jgi:hypothetical protein
MLERLDYQYREEVAGQGPVERRPVKDTFRQSMYSCFWFERVGPTKLLEEIGAGNVLWTTDFPHPTCLYPDPVGRTAEVLKDVPAETLRRIMQDNAVGLYKLPLASAAPATASRARQVPV